MAELQFVNPYSGRVAALQQALAAAQAREVPPAFSPEEIQQRQMANQRQEMLGTLAQLSGDKAAAPVGGNLLKMAMADRQKRITDRGEYDPMTGQYRLHPEARMAQEADAIEKQLQQAALAEGRAQEMWDRDRARAQEQSALRQTLAAIAAASKQSSQGMIGTWQYTGNAPDGTPVLFNNKTGQLATGGPNGLQLFQGGAPLKREEYAKKMSEQNAAQAAVNTARKTIQDAEALPGAFNTWKGTAQQALPEFLQGAAGLGLWTPEQRQIRGRIYSDAAMRIHELIGAAQTDTERKGLIDFMPQRTDPPEIILDKLRSAEQMASQKLQGVSKVGPAAAPMGPYQGAPAPGAPAAGPAGPGASPGMPPGLPPGVTVRQVR